LPDSFAPLEQGGDDSRAGLFVELLGCWRVVFGVNFRVAFRVVVPPGALISQKFGRTVDVSRSVSKSKIETV